MKTSPFLVLALLATAATAAESPKNHFEGGAFETWDEASGLPTATPWRWSLPEEPFSEIGLSQALRGQTRLGRYGDRPVWSPARRLRKRRAPSAPRLVTSIRINHA